MIRKYSLARKPNTTAQHIVNMSVGSITKIPAMIESKRYCPEIIQQIDSVIGLLKRARSELLRAHLDSCLAHQIKIDKIGAIDELLKIYNMK
jgi:DNA-binding FrmR family transcriptional regulator